MRFWDTSAVLPLLVRELTSEAMIGLLAEDRDVVAWWATETECASVLSRLEREGRLSATEMARVLGRLDTLRNAWHEVQPAESLRLTARRLLRVHALCAGDALQLGAAIAAADHDASSLDMVCLDDRLRLAAEREGFGVLPLPT